MNDHITHTSGRRKNVCGAAVLTACGVPLTRFHYAEYLGDVKRVLGRHGWSVRSRWSALPRSVRTVGALRRHLNRERALGNEPAGSRYLVLVKGHVLLLAEDGNVLADTDPRLMPDRRRIKQIYAVFPKGGVA